MTLGSDATGDIYYRDASGFLERLASGADGTVLTGTGAGAIPAWESPAVGDITSVVAGAGMTGGGTTGDVTLNVIGGDGITANADDVAITAAQTTVTSVYNASLKMGRDSQNLIDFATTDNKIILRVNNVDEVELVADTLQPTTSDGVALGTASLMWSDLFLASGSVINFAAGDVTLTHSSETLTVAGGTLAAAGITGTTIDATTDFTIGDTVITDGVITDTSGLSVASATTVASTLTVGANTDGHDVKFFGNATGSYMEWDESADQLRILGPSTDAAGSSGKLLLATAQTAVAANDILGQIDFQAPLETGTDATAIAAAIRAVAQGTFSASVNATDLIFYTGHSEAATEKFRMTSQGELGVGGANYGTNGQVLTSGGAGAAPTWADASGGSFSGPGSSTDNAVVRFNGTGGATGQNSGIIIDDSNNITGAANVTLSGELDAATGDFSGDVDVDGTLETDALTIGGTALLANDTNNRVTTATGSGTLNGEANLTFDGSTLAVTGALTTTGDYSSTSSETGFKYLTLKNTNNTAGADRASALVLGGAINADGYTQGNIEFHYLDTTVAQIVGMSSGSTSGTGRGGALRFFTKADNGGNNERLRILAGGGLTFNGDTAAANALDDYEEGTFSPVLRYSTSSYTSSDNSGRYIKIGRLVWISANLTITNAQVNNGSDTLNIQGLPFTCTNETAAHSRIVFTFMKYVGGTTVMDVTSYTSVNTTQLTPLILFNNGGAWQGVPSSHFYQADGSQGVFFTGCYFASA